LKLNNIAELLIKERENEKSIVLCHGVFDLLHLGHIKYFQKAKSYGDVLIVTVTPDEYVRRGPGRPVFTAEQRTEAIAALDAAKSLSNDGISTGVRNMHTLKPIDVSAIIEIADKTSLILTVEEHNIIGGLGSAVAEVLSENGCNVLHKRIGIRDNFCYGVGSQNFHLERNGISVSNITQIIKKELNK
jgi:cytidyltransferase-like protein